MKLMQDCKIRCRSTDSNQAIHAERTHLQARPETFVKTSADQNCTGVARINEVIPAYGIARISKGNAGREWSQA